MNIIKNIINDELNIKSFHDCINGGDINFEKPIKNKNHLDKVIEVLNFIPSDVLYLYDTDKLAHVLYDYMAQTFDPYEVNLTMNRVAHAFKNTKTGLINVPDHSKLTEAIYRCLKLEWYISPTYLDEFRRTLGKSAVFNHGIRSRASYGTANNLLFNDDAEIAISSKFVIEIKNIYVYTQENTRKRNNIWIDKSFADYLSKLNLDSLKCDLYDEENRLGIKLAAVLEYTLNDDTTLDRDIDTIRKDHLPKIQENIDKLLDLPAVKRYESVLDVIKRYYHESNPGYYCIKHQL